MAGGTGHRFDTLRTRRLAAGISATELARRSNTSDLIVSNLEAGGNCDPAVSGRIVNALAPPVAVTSTSVASPSVVTVAAHTFVTGDTVTIAGHAGSTPAVSGDYVVTVIGGTSFSIPLNVTGGGTGGTAALAGASAGQARLS